MKFHMRYRPSDPTIDNKELSVVAFGTKLASHVQS